MKLGSAIKRPILIGAGAVGGGPQELQTSGESGSFKGVIKNSKGVCGKYLIQKLIPIRAIS